MFGVPESSTEEDEVKAKEILQKVSDKDIDMVSVTKTGIKPFPLKVKFKEEKDKWKVICQIIQPCPEDRLHEEGLYKKRYDREREGGISGLRNELKERRVKSVQDVDGARWIIRKGKVINLTREKKDHRSGTRPRNMDHIHLSQTRGPNQTRKRNVVNTDSESAGRVSPLQHHSSASVHNTPQQGKCHGRCALLNPNNGNNLRPPTKCNKYNLYCLSFNADNLRNKLQELNTLVYTYNPDVIAVQEILPKNISDIITESIFNVNGYELFTNEKQGGKGVWHYT